MTTATKEFSKRHANVAALARMIVAEIDDFGAGEEINWSHVGSLGHLESELAEAACFISNDQAKVEAIIGRKLDR